MPFPLLAGLLLLGMLTGIGGGVMRDLLLREIPVVMRAELYAVAALAGAIVVVCGHLLGLATLPMMISGACVCFGMRLLAIQRGWSLSVARHEA